MHRFKHLCGTFAIDGTLARKENDAVGERVPGSEGDGLETQNILSTMTAMRNAVDIVQLRERNIALTKSAISASVTSDLMIINAINNIDEIDKIANTLAKRLREWYALHDPELEHSTPEHRAFVEALLTAPARSADTMGGTLTDTDIAILNDQASRIRDLYVQRDKLLVYLEETMRQHTPNIAAVAGGMIGGKLIALAGSLQRLATMPSGTVQLLGAETALFRHLRNPRARPPKHGIIFNHVLLQRAPKPLRGKAARAIADKISIAAKVDRFKGAFIGDKLYAEIESKIIEAMKVGTARNERERREAGGRA
ncbi:TPA: hypothetical protein HA251_04220 [Candidatus Woesearchaeota archaeon]|nr:hypothetical protein [Candidatus Woesearchaeota archaeon]